MATGDARHAIALAPHGHGSGGERRPRTIALAGPLHLGRIDPERDIDIDIESEAAWLPLLDSRVRGRLAPTDPLDVRLSR